MNLRYCFSNLKHISYYITVSGCGCPFIERQELRHSPSGQSRGRQQVQDKRVLRQGSAHICQRNGNKSKLYAQLRTVRRRFLFGQKLSS